MRRVALLVMLLAQVLAGCGGRPPDTSAPHPPKSTPLERNDNVNKVLEGWKREVPAAMKSAGAKDPVEQKVFRSTATLQEIAEFYHPAHRRGRRQAVW